MSFESDALNRDFDEEKAALKLGSIITIGGGALTAASVIVNNLIETKPLPTNLPEGIAHLGTAILVIAGLEVGVLAAIAGGVVAASAGIMMVGNRLKKAFLPLQRK